MALENLSNLLDKPQTATEAGLSPYERRIAAEKNLITIVKERGAPVVRKTGSKGRPAHVLKLTAKGARLARKNA